MASLLRPTFSRLSFPLTRYRIHQTADSRTSPLFLSWYLGRQISLFSARRFILISSRTEHLPGALRVRGLFFVTFDPKIEILNVDHSTTAPTDDSEFTRDEHTLDRAERQREVCGGLLQCEQPRGAKISAASGKVTGQPFRNPLHKCLNEPAERVSRSSFHWDHFELPPPEAPLAELVVRS